MNNKKANRDLAVLLTKKFCREVDKAAYFLNLCAQNYLSHFTIILKIRSQLKAINTFLYI